MMDTLDDSENNVKVSDSAYSNSCSNSLSRRSRSSKSTHSGSNSSGSSGYGGKPSTSSSSNDLGQPPEKRSKDKEPKKKKSVETLLVISEQQQVSNENKEDVKAVSNSPIEEIKHDATPLPPTPVFVQPEIEVEKSETKTKSAEKSAKDVAFKNNPHSLVSGYSTGRSNIISTDGFSCVISMHDGVVMYTTSSLTSSLGFPKEIWIGRSFIDFVHPKDRSTFASQITSGLAEPKNVSGIQVKDQSLETSPVSTIFCRIRRYRGLTSGFAVKDRVVAYMPFHLRLSFKNISDEEGKVVYLVIQATPFFSAFKAPNEVISRSVPFVIRHVANGNMEYVDQASVPFLGYLPQDIIDKDALALYHPEDLSYLEQVYEIIVREGGMPRSKPYRMLTQNGHYLKLETEWSSFINPWSKKLEFVIGKHHVIEGPSNPDVFQSPEQTISEKPTKVSEEEKKNAQILRDNIVRIMNEVLTKPAEAAKLQMTKRCQDLASFMESLMEEPPRPEDELRLEIQDPDNSYYERDSVMLGGISPHHDYTDSKSSTETPLSYTQLNYNETLQRYFDSHQPHNYYEDYNTTSGENILGLKIPKSSTQLMKIETVVDISKCLSPMVQCSHDSGDLTSSGESMSVAVFANSPSAPLSDYLPVRLTETLLIKHNTDMEKDLVKKHREVRFTKGVRSKVTNENRIKKKEHLARCNAAFQPTPIIVSSEEQQLNLSKRVASSLPGVNKRRKHRLTNRNPHGVKRVSKPMEGEGIAKKHHRPTISQTRRIPTTVATTQVTPSVTNSPVNQWQQQHANNMNAYMPGLGIPQQMSIVSPVAAVTDVFPMYYVPTTGMPMQASTDVTNQEKPSGTFPATTPTMQYMMYGQAIFGSPIVYSPFSHQLPFQMPHSVLAEGVYNQPRPLGLTASNYEEACKSSLPPKSLYTRRSWREKKLQATLSNVKQGSAVESSVSSSKTINQESGTRSSDCHSGIRNSPMDLSDNRSSSNSTKSNKAVPVTTPSRDNKMNTGTGNSEEVRTDGDSSYSSFYSSFFKTESGSAEESGDAKKKKVHIPKNQREQDTKDWPRRKMEPPWMEQVCVTSELIYKYQVLTRDMKDVLTADKEKMQKLEQPSMVNEQLGQLYLDLQLEGVAARLTLEDGITSSGSSGEETINPAKHGSKSNRRKREYNKLVMIYEEDAPLPPAPSPGMDT